MMSLRRTTVRSHAPRARSTARWTAGHRSRRVAPLQQSLAQRVAELQDALASVKTLSGLLPICSYCKKIRDDSDYWQHLESYLSDHSQAEFSHGICPDCLVHARGEFGV